MGLKCVTLRILFECIGSNTNNSFLQSNHTNACTLNNDFLSTENSRKLRKESCGDGRQD